MQNRLILFQGDSITDGNRIKGNTTDLNHQIGHSYAYCISAKLGAENPQKGYRFVNRGISGNTVFDLAKRWEEDCLSFCPDVLSILVGVNDVHYSIFADRKVDIKAFEDTYRKIIGRMQLVNPQAKIILMEPFSLCLGGPATQWDAWHSLLCDIQKSVAAVAEQTGVYFIPLQKMFDELCSRAEASYWIWDGVHPTENGHWMLAKAWLGFVEQNGILG